jgi:hypothetical protein
MLGALLTALAACTSASKDAATDTTTPAVTPTAAVTDAPSCWLQEGTAADAAARPSPLGEVRFSLGSQEALLCYGRPSAKGRTVMGALVPYGEPWRLGANEATTLYLPFAAHVGGPEVQPGTYSLYVVPGQTEWEFFINRQAQRWGIPINAEVTGANVGSFKAPVGATAAPVEQLTFRWEGTDDSTGQMVMEWASTQVKFTIHRIGS